MKKVTIYAALFSVAFAFAIGLMATDQASAIPECTRFQCICDLYCSWETGPNCTNPNLPYYLYSVDCVTIPGEKCGGCYQFEGLIGCCRFPEG